MLSDLYMELNIGGQCSVCGRVQELFEFPGRREKFCLACSADVAIVVHLAHEIAAGRVCEVPEQRESMLDRAWRSLTGNLRQSAAKRLAATQEPDRR